MWGGHELSYWEFFFSILHSSGPIPGTSYLAGERGKSNVGEMLEKMTDSWDRLSGLHGEVSIPMAACPLESYIAGLSKSHCTQLHNMKPSHRWRKMRWRTVRHSWRLVRWTWSPYRLSFKVCPSQLQGLILPPRLGWDLPYVRGQKRSYGPPKGTWVDLSEWFLGEQGHHRLQEQQWHMSSRRLSYREDVAAFAS